MSIEETVCLWIGRCVAGMAITAGCLAFFGWITEFIARKAVLIYDFFEFMWFRKEFMQWRKNKP